MQHKTHESGEESQIRVQRRKELPALRVCQVDAAVAVGFKWWQKKAERTWGAQAQRQRHP